MKASKVVMRAAHAQNTFAVVSVVDIFTNSSLRSSNRDKALLKILLLSMTDVCLHVLNALAALSTA